MDKIIEFCKSVGWRKIIATAVLIFVIGLLYLSATSCSSARGLVSGNRVVDKNVRDSTHYEVSVEK